MPKLYEYFGLIILFYSNEHDPVHVHGKYQGYESRAEFFIVDGKIVEIRYASVRGKAPLPARQAKDFEALVAAYAEEIVEKWINYFILHKAVQSERITRKLR